MKKLGGYIYFKFLFIYFIFGCTGFYCAWLSLASESDLLTALASLIAEHGLQTVGSVVVIHRLSCPLACGIFLDQGLNPCPLHWQADSQSLDYQRSACSFEVYGELPFRRPAAGKWQVNIWTQRSRKPSLPLVLPKVGSRQKCEVEEDPSVLPLFLEPALWVICYYLS